MTAICLQPSVVSLVVWKEQCVCQPTSGGGCLQFADASDVFLQALEGIVEPEQKPRIIGETFVQVFQDQAERLGIGA